MLHANFSFAASMMPTRESQSRSSQRQILGSASSQTPFIPKSPFICAKTQELVWMWEQLKLCGQSINTMLQCVTLPSHTMINKPDEDCRFVSVDFGETTVLPPATVTSLQPLDYNLGISCVPNEKDRKLIILGIAGTKNVSSIRKLARQLWNPVGTAPLTAVYSWSTEYWVSASVVIDIRSMEGTDLMDEAVRAGRSAAKAYVCIGLPAISFGPLFNTLVSTCNVNAACFNLAIGYIWMAASVDPTRLEVEGDDGSRSFGNLFLSMIHDETQGSWLVEAKLRFWLGGTSRMKVCVLAELLEMRDIRTTSTHRPIARS